MTKYDKSCLDIDMVVYKENQEEFTEDEVEALFDSFIEWVEKNKLFAAGAVYYPKEEEHCQDNCYQCQCSPDSNKPDGGG